MHAEGREQRAVEMETPEVTEKAIEVVAKDGFLEEYRGVIREYGLGLGPEQVLKTARVALDKLLGLERSRQVKIPTEMLVEQGYIICVMAGIEKKEINRTILAAIEEATGAKNIELTEMPPNAVL